MASTRVTKVGYGSKLGNSIKGIFGGFIAILIAIVLLWWNEGNSVREIKKVKEGKAALVEISSESVNPDNEGNLVHLFGFATTNDTLTDPRFGIEVNAIKLERVVEMYQYKENKKTEEKDNLGGSTTVTETFTYEEVWSSSLINSDNFYESWRKNPKAFENKAEKWNANNVTLDAFKLSEGIINSMSGFEALPVNPELADSNQNFQITQGLIYYGYDAKFPEIGDERISYRVLYPQDVSIIAQQFGQTFKPFKTKVGKDIQLVMRGNLTADEMWAAEESKNTMIRWILRLVGFLLMFGGFTAIFKPLAVAGSVIPFLGKIVGFGTSLIAGVLSFSISLIVIAIAWIFYRPLLGVLLLVVAIGGFVLAKKYLFKSKEEVAIEEGKTNETEDGELKG
jgi:hypothetical protein